MGKKYGCSKGYAQRNAAHMGWMLHGSNSDRVRDNSLFIGYLGSFPGIEQPECEVVYSFPSGVKVKNEWSCNSAPPICLHGMEKEDTSLVLKSPIFNELELFQI
jgi:hypothetical protein